jgi:drug/metabolite transporter (DMT)-like permease
MSGGKNLSRIASIALFAAAFIWGTSFVIMKDVSDRLPPSLLLAIRFTVACLLLGAISWKRFRKLNRSYVFPGLLIGSLLFSAYLVQTYGLIGTTPGKNAFLTASYCVITPFLFRIVSGKKTDPFHLVSAVVCLGGILLISVDFASERLFSIALGDVLTLICGFFYAAHIVAIATTAQDKDPMLITLLQFGVAAVLSWITYAVLNAFGLAPLSLEGADIGSLALQLLYLACACTGAALFLQNFGQKHTSPSAAALILTFESVFGTLFSVIMGREELGFRIISGFVLIFLAVVISETKLSFLKKKKGETLDVGN